MNCEEFLERYSEYRDERTAAGELERFERHLEDCEACRRHDRVVSRGVEVFRDLPAPSPSPDFYDRLKHRIYHLEDGIPATSRWPTGSAAVLAVAAAGLLALAWVPFASRATVEVELPPVSARQPDAAAPRTVDREPPSLFQSGPFVAPDDARAGSWRSRRHGSASSLFWEESSPANRGVSLGGGSTALSRGLR